MTSIETHKIAVEKVMNFFSQYTCFTNLTSNRDKKEFTTIDEYEKKYFYAQVKTQSEVGKFWIEARKNNSFETTSMPNESELRKKYLEQYSTLTDRQKENFDTYVQMKEFLNFGDFKFQDTELDVHNVRVVAGYSLGRRALKMAKYKYTIFVNPEKVEESKVCRTQTLVRYADTLPDYYKWVDFSKIKNFCLLKDLPMFYVQLALLGGTATATTVSSGKTVSNVLNNPGFVGFSSAGWNAAAKSSKDLPKNAYIDLVNAFFTKVIPIKAKLA